MSHDRDESPQPQVSDPTGRSSEAAYHSFGTTRDRSHLRRNADELAGETVEVAGESTGRFPRVESAAHSDGEGTGRSAFMVGAGILISRIIGVIRQRVFAHSLGPSDAK